MRRVTGHTLTVGKGRMSGLLGHGTLEFLMAGKAEFPFPGTRLKKGVAFAAMRGMTRRALPPSKRLMNTEKGLFNSDLLMA